MLRSIGALLIIVTFSLEASAQIKNTEARILVIPLNKIIGFGKASGTIYYFSKKKFEETDNFGRKVSGYIFTHHYQPIQKHYQEFLKGEIDKNKFDQLFKFYKSDSSELSVVPFKGDISLKIIFENNGFVSITPDQNNNNNYVDDVSFRLPIKKNKKDGLEYETEFLPVFKFDNILYFDKGKFLTKSAYFRISPYFDWGKGEELDSIKVDKIFFEGFEYRLGKLKIDSLVYNIYLNGPVFQFKYDLINTNVLIVESDKFIPPNYGYLIRKLNDTISISDYSFIPYHVSEFGDSLYIKLQKRSQGTYGFHQGDQFPNFKGETLNGKVLDIYRAKKDGYLLLDFFGSWCLPCIANFPRLKKLHELYSTFNFKIVGIANERDSSFLTLKKLVAKEGLKWEVIKQSRKTNFDIINFSKVHTYPTYLLISPTNEVIYECGGDEDFRNLEKILENLFKDK